MTLPAFLNHRLGAYRLAIGEYAKAIYWRPLYALAYVNRGLAFYMLRRFGQSIKCFDRALSIKKDYALAYHNRGMAYMQQGMLRRAEKDFAKARQLGIKKP